MSITPPLKGCCNNVVGLFKRALRTPLGQAALCVARPWLVFTILFAFDKMAFDLQSGFTIGQLARIFIVSSAWSALVCSPYLLLGRWARCVYLPLAVLLLLSDIVQWHVGLNFTVPLDGNWIFLLQGTSKEELLVYVKTFFGWRTLLCLLAVPFAVFLLAFVLRQDKERSSRLDVLIFLLLCCSGVGFFVVRDASCLKSPCSFIKKNLVCGRFVVTTFEQIQFFKPLKALKEHPSIGGAPRVSSNAAPVGVFVLGESATRNRWSLYGYAKTTTPEMSAMESELVVFSNLVGVAIGTDATMKLLLSEATLDRKMDYRCTLPQVLSRAGYDCVALTAQGGFKFLDGPDAMFCGCSRIRFMLEEHKDLSWYDDVLLDAFAQELAKKSEKPRVFFIHLRGSHFPPAQFVPPDFGPFPHESQEGDNKIDPRKNAGNYDNTIAFTDMILGKIVGMLKARGGSSWMFYVSDHGESVDSPRFRMPSDPSLWELPMVFWTSPEYRASHAELMAKARACTDAPLQSDLLFATILKICDVEGYESARPETSFEAAPFGYRKVRRICDGAKVYERRR